MTATFADYAASQDARNAIQLNVTKWTLMLCDALKQNYIDYSIRSHERSLFRDFGENSVAHHESCIEKLKNGECEYDFVIESGRKYHKIIMVIDNGPDRSPSRSVHAFVDKKTGSVLKSASWKSPAKGERYNLLNIEQREWLLENASWCGGYLYAK
jgi:hypothetical protein